LEPLNEQKLLAIVAEAIDRWSAAGLDAHGIRILSQVRVEVTDLPDSYLGLTMPNVVWIDQDASGFGWFADASPADSMEFRPALSGDGLRARRGTPAFGRMDLLTTVEHELGHVLGLEHSQDRQDVMSEDLQPGVRKLPNIADVRLLGAQPVAQHLNRVGAPAVSDDPRLYGPGQVKPTTALEVVTGPTNVSRSQDSFGRLFPALSNPSAHAVAPVAEAAVPHAMAELGALPTNDERPKQTPEKHRRSASLEAQETTDQVLAEFEGLVLDHRWY
jgi:hypothetical protein